MRTLVREIRKLERGEVGVKVRQRLQEFKVVQKKGDHAWFEELCFCILAANSKSKTSWAIQKELGAKGFLTLSQEQLSACILRNKHRFHNTKARYIIAARPFVDIKQRLTKIMGQGGEPAARAWLVENIMGFGYKEASHYLRNLGFLNFAVLDRHILFVMAEHGLIDAVPSSLSPKKYLEYEKSFQTFARKIGMSCGELDYYFWYMRAGDVLK